MIAVHITGSNGRQDLVTKLVGRNEAQKPALNRASSMQSSFLLQFAALVTSAFVLGHSGRP